LFTAALPSINFRLDFCGPVGLEDGAVAVAGVAAAVAVSVAVGVAVGLVVVDKG